MGLKFYQAKDDKGWDRAYIDDKDHYDIHGKAVLLKEGDAITLYIQIDFVGGNSKFSYRAKDAEKAQYNWNPPNNYQFALLVTPDGESAMEKAMHKAVKDLAPDQEYCFKSVHVDEKSAIAYVNEKIEIPGGQVVALTPESITAYKDMVFGSVIVNPTPVIPRDGLKPLKKKQGGNGFGGGSKQDEYDRLKDRQKWLQEALGVTDMLGAEQLLSASGTPSDSWLMQVLRLILG